MRLEPSVFDTSQNTEALAASLAIGWRVATPAFNPAAAYYSSAQTISITTATTGAKIYFTDDGSIPSSSATMYSTPFHIWSAAGKTIQAIGTKSGMPDSSIASGVFGYSTLKTGQA
ncbi:MAG TPA: chitobiase/beta-hexosaminidase C-terminal domain-containing protein, partial [Leptospiraceae bacterium]|nr:chitobiase/beta-hexosaminidase C-terminal domain-containing protein [Leptospiraceae bacterium]